jgi:sirohydrochlorin cobaltochelatase
MPILPGNKIAIVLVMFGTSVEKGLPGVLRVRDRFLERFPRSTVKLSFTSTIIRQIWQDRAADPNYRSAHPEVPGYLLPVSPPREAIQELQESGADVLVIQPVHLAPALEEIQVESYIGKEAKGQFAKIAVGRPALGVLQKNKYSYHDDIKAVACSIDQDMELARQEKAALFYMGHGNKEPETELVYNTLLKEIRSQHPDVQTYMGMIEGGPPADEIVAELKRNDVKRVILKPFMIVAGDHVRKDMIGDGAHTLKRILEGAGITVQPVLSGLGEIPAFADIFIDHALDAAKDACIVLK